MAFTTLVNLLSDFTFSVDFAQYDLVITRPNIVDFFPILKMFDPQGLLRRGNVCVRKIMTIFDRVIDQRLQTLSTSSTNNDVLDMLLNLNQKNESMFNRNDMRHLFFVLFIAGTDTVSSTLEWAMAELIHNPSKLEKARSEITKLMENKKKIIQESDIPQLPYLQAVIKETLRLHPRPLFLSLTKPYTM
ncbi:putative geraniol 8-hydroxylase [Helianthus annuus]|nr:putative geraniol 8-hydroxylase [Helianthus annuus]